LGSSSSACADYLHAIERRDSFGPRDAAILKALGPCVLTEPTDFKACIAGLGPLRAAYPRDTELLFFIASIEAMAGDVDVSTSLFREALRLDPGFGFAWARVGQDEAYAGRFDAARRAFATCLEIVPTSTFCRMNRLWVNDQEGDPAACEADARALTVIAPDDTAYLEVFPQAIAAQGHPRSAVEDALRPVQVKWDRTKTYRGPQTSAALDVLDGRFEAARASFESLQERYAANRDPWRWLYITRALFGLLAEVGDADAGVRLAENLRARLPVLPTNQGAEDWAIAQDPTLLFDDALLRGRVITRAERDARRGEWLEAWGKRTSAEYRPYLWIQAFATYADAPEEATSAIVLLPSYGPIPAYRPKTATNADIGHTMLLAGDAAGAVPYLRKATRSCTPLDFPIPYVRSRLWLGDALAKTGDTKGACDALAWVVAHWGDAKPRSVTATAARAKIRELRCDAR
jgi:serine/threonine-protein kinase